MCSGVSSFLQVSGGVETISRLAGEYRQNGNEVLANKMAAPRIGVLLHPTDLQNPEVRRCSKTMSLNSKVNVNVLAP